MNSQHTSSPAGPGAKLVLGVVLLGLVAMIGATVLFRANGEPLVRYNGPSLAQNVGGMPGMPMPPQGMDGTLAQDAVPSSMAGTAGQPQEAMIAAMQRLQADANDVDAMLMLADMFMEQDNMGSAQGFINRAMVAAPSDARPAYYLGVLQARQGQYQEAATAMERSLALQDNPATRYSVAVIYLYHLNDAAKSRAHLEAASASPDLPADLRSLIETELAK